MQYLGFLAAAQGCKSAECWPISLHKGEGSSLKRYTVANSTNKLSKLFILRYFSFEMYILPAYLYTGHLETTKGPMLKTARTHIQIVMVYQRWSLYFVFLRMLA